jgi:hypothetical protein
MFIERGEETMGCTRKTAPCGDGSVLIRSYQKDDIDYIIDKHRELYDKEYGFSSDFVDYVEKYVKELELCSKM